MCVVIRNHDYFFTIELKANPPVIPEQEPDRPESNVEYKTDKSETFDVLFNKFVPAGRESEIIQHSTCSGTFQKSFP